MPRQKEMGRLDEAKERVQEWEEDVEDRIREKPVQSVLIAFGVGLLAGAIVSALIRRK